MRGLALALLTVSAVTAQLLTDTPRLLIQPNGPSASTIYIVTADGAHERPLLMASGLDYNASLLPDGQAIALTSERNASPAHSADWPWLAGRDGDAASRARPQSSLTAQPLLGLLEEYHHLVQRYRREKLEAIQRDLARWKPGRLQQATTVLLDVARQPIPGAGLNVSPWRAIDIAAATVLHLELFVDGAKHGVFEHWHLRVASQLLATPAGTRIDPMLRHDAMKVVAWLLQISGQFELLRSHLDAAVDEAPPPPELLMALGVLQEASASPRVQPDATGVRADDGLMQAAETYRRVLRADPTLAEARVRLGFVLLRLGRIDEARAELAAALDQTAHTKVRYLAALFHGAAQEASGRHDGARASFQHAHDLAPACQVAALALAQQLWLDGQTDDAASLLKQAAHTGPAACDDPWWSYDFGQAWQLEASLERLRTSVRA